MCEELFRRSPRGNSRHAGQGIKPVAKPAGSAVLGEQTHQNSLEMEGGSSSWTAFVLVMRTLGDRRRRQWPAGRRGSGVESRANDGRPTSAPDAPQVYDTTTGFGPGMMILTVKPLGVSFLRKMSPPWDRTVALAMERPNPKPPALSPLASSTLKKGANT